jgi:hypothetical protein
MWVPSGTYDAVAAIVLGYDTACEGGALVGFKEWLVIRLGRDFANLYWPALVLKIAFPNEQVPERALTSKEANRKAIDVLFSLIAEFDAERSARGGLARILSKYGSITTPKPPKKKPARPRNRS